MTYPTALIRAIFERLAERTARPPAETAFLREPARVRRRQALYFALLLAFALGFGPLFCHYVAAWRGFHTEVPLAENVWHLLPAGPAHEGCAENTTVDAKCPASAENPALWTAPLREINVRAERPESFWVGATISPGNLRDAWSRKANRLLLGWFNARYRIWIDGKLVAVGPGGETEPVVLPLPFSRLAEVQPLRVAVEFQDKQPGRGRPDTFNAQEGGEGFLTTESENVFRTRFAFTIRMRQFSLMLAYTIIGVLFIFFWRVSPIRQEYFVFALFALSSGMVRARYIDLFNSQMSNGLALALQNALGVYMLLTALFLGFSYARLRSAVFRWSVPVAVAVPAIVFAGQVSGIIPIRAGFAFNQFRREWVTPVCFTGAAAACWLQAWYLATRRAGHRIRVRRLLVFGLGMLVLALVYFFENHGQTQKTITLFSLLQGYEHFLCVLFFAALALRDYGEQEKLVQKIPVSRYHRQTELPSMIRGALLAVDLKNSEALFRLGSRDGNSGMYVETCLSHLWNAVTRAQGVVLQTDGDGLHAFFDEECCANPLIAAQCAVDEMRGELATLGTRFREEHQLPAEACALQFRGGLAIGEIRPVWHERGGERYASWAETGETHAFVESARLMDLERKLVTEGPLTQVVLAESAAQEIERVGSPAKGRWTTRDHTLTGKHAMVYRVAVYLPGSER